MTRDPMMEIFMAECQDLISQYETYLSMADEKQEYDLNLINEIFRITHTLKADATMMLYECVAVPMRAFEKVLYYCRDEIHGVLDFDEFSAVLMEVIEYTADELMRIENGSAQPTDGDGLRERILAYRDRLAARMHPDEVEQVEEKAKSELRAEPMRFYIGSQTETLNETAETKQDVQSEGKEPISEPAASQTAVMVDRIGVAVNQDHAPVSTQKLTVSTGDITELYHLIERLQQMEEQVVDRFSDKVILFSDLLCAYDGLLEELRDWATKAWMTPISYLSPKLRRTVHEMNDRLGRTVTLTIEGEHVAVEKGWLDRLSSTMVHLIRNAIDHGIESKESRISKGKSPEGNICISYRHLEEDNHFELIVEDDGRGVNADKIKEAAIQRGLVSVGDEMSFENILNLMFAPGVTTNERVSEYSGRGVGMDTVWHNINELGGTICVDSERNHGLKVLIRIPYHSEAEEKEEISDEDIDSRR